MAHRVLIVDDSLTVRMDLADALTSAGLSVETCATLEAARTWLREGSFSLLVLDVLLPDGDGVDLLRELRSPPHPSSIPVMLLSTESEVRDRVRGLTGGADRFVGKPYDRDYIVTRARELIGNDEASDVDETILVIDDSDTFREALREALEQTGYRVRVARGGEEGLHLAAALRPTAIIVDGVMDDLAGATVIRRVRLDMVLRRTPCLLLTASSDDGDEIDALDSGADAFVRKSEPMDVILARLFAVLRTAAGGVSSPAARSSLGPTKILAVDDSATYLYGLTDQLRSEGYEVVPARSGEEALELLAVEAVDCILLDLLMPGMSGRETCSRLRDTPITRDVPIIMLTAVEDHAAMVEGLAAGADDYIAKSSEFEVLKARVRAQLRRKHFEEENRLYREQLFRVELEAREARTRQELAETRAALLEDVERKNRELEAFSYSVSHDLRAPLRSIDGFSLALMEDYGEHLDEGARNYLARIRAAAQRMGELIDDLLELARVSRAELRWERVDLAELAREVMAQLRSHEPDRNVDLRTPNSVSVSGDKRLLRVVMENLLGNAWKFTSRVDAAKIELRAESAGDHPCLCIQDNGAGFDMAYAARLFQPFQRLHRAEDFAGTGIGLATVQRIVERHGGNVWAEATLGEGARFFFTLGNVPAGAHDGTDE